MTIDPAVQAFAEASERFDPPDAARRTIAEKRRRYEAYARGTVLYACKAFAGQLAAAGRIARPVVAAGLVHGFLRDIDQSAAAHAAVADIVRFVAERLRPPGRPAASEQKQ